MIVKLAIFFYLSYVSYKTFIHFNTVTLLKSTKKNGSLKLLKAGIKKIFKVTVRILFDKCYLCFLDNKVVGH